jgi:DNA-binding NarL/FixJ family response regulator
MNMLSIFITDDHDIVRQGVRAQLSQRAGWEVCGEACDGREAVKQCRELKPDVVVMDLSMPDLNGVEATRQIKRDLAKTEVVIFTRHDTDQMVVEALWAGARAYVRKSDAHFHLISAVAALASHRSYFTSSVSATLLDTFEKITTGGNEREGKILTLREREVLQMLTEGRSNRQVATELQISVKTVETHRSSVMRKLDINSIVDLVHYAIRNQIVEA